MPEWGAGTQRVAIVGAGLAGCLLATLLARRGIDVTVYERREDPRVTAPERGRSINLAISARGLEALAQVGLRELSLSRALPMHGRMVHSRDGQQSFRPYSADGTQAINSISRAELNLALLEVAERTPGVCVRFGHRLSELDMATGRAVVRDRWRAACGAGRHRPGRRRRLQRGATVRDVQARLHLQPGLPAARLQGAHDPAAGRASSRLTRTRCTSGRAARR